MPGYWWECDGCHTKRTFEEVTGRGPVVFICDDLSVDWDQAKLRKPCGVCTKGLLRVTFEFPREEKETLTVIHIVGLTPPERDGYLPMIWETIPRGEPDGTRWFHFNYIYRRRNWGLNKAAVFERGDLGRLFELFHEKTGNRFIP
jgi:hypothetical protein